MYALVLSGCFAPLVDERVIETDLDATFVYGHADDRLGGTVAWSGAEWTATGLAMGRLPAGHGWGDTDGDPVDVDDVVFAGWYGQRLVVALATGDWFLDGLLQGHEPGVRVWAAGTGGVVIADGGGVRSLLGALDLGDGSGVWDVVALAVGTGDMHDAPIYAMACGEECRALMWVDQEVVATWPAGGGGAIAEWDGVPWAGDPEDDVPDGAGRVCNPYGECVVGEPGDHLGSSIGGGYAGGTFNSRIVPPRARFVALDGRETLALERGAEQQLHALDGDAHTLVVGAPYYPHDGGPAGMVSVVER